METLSKKGKKTLFSLAQNGTVEALECSIAHAGSWAAAVKLRDGAGDTLLHRACRGGNGTVTKKLIEEGAEVDVTNGLFKTPMHEAAWAGSKECVQLLLDAGALLNPTKYNDWTPFMYSCENGHFDVIRFLLNHMSEEERKRSLEEKNKEGSSSLYLACRNGSIDVVKALLEAGADPNSMNNTFRTPSHASVMAGSVEALEALKDAGADMSVRDSSGTTLWHEAAAHGHVESLQTLAKWTSLPNTAEAWGRDRSGRHPLHVAAREGQVGALKFIIELLEKASADGGNFLNIGDIDGATPVHLAAAQGNADAVRVLLASGADITSLSSNGKTALDLAQGWKRAECVSILANWPSTPDHETQEQSGQSIQE